jgi:molybdopterin biosynthesis enzyme
MIAREAGYASLDLRVPRVKIYNAGEAHISSDFITASLATYGAWVEASPTLDFSSADLILTIGGTGDGSADHMIEVLRAQCDLLCHGLACAPSRSMAIARHGSVPVIAIPGTPADALASLHFIIKPVLTMLSACSSELTLRLPLAQKIASRVGIAELALLARRDECFVPLAVGDMPLRLMAEATHLCYLPAASEGHAAGEMIDAFSVSEAAA